MYGVHQTLAFHVLMIETDVFLKCSLKNNSGTSQMWDEIILRVMCIILYQERKLCTEEKSL